MRRLILLRHGQTDYNVDGRMQGHLDSHLTDAGHEQAAEAAPVLASLAPDRLVSSDLRRAVDTAEVVGAACGLPVKFDPRLRETHLGYWQGRTVAEIERDYPGAIATWRSDPAWAPPEGESRIDVVRAVPPGRRGAGRRVRRLRRGRRRPCCSSRTAASSPGWSAGLLDAAAVGLAVVRGLGNCRWAALARRDDHPRWRLAGYNVGAA